MVVSLASELMETTCGSLLQELQVIWDEVGESDEKRDELLLELEKECLEVYKRMVDQANRSRAQLRKAIADSEAELAAICSAMGERPVHLHPNGSSLKEELKAIIPELEEMRKKKAERWRQFRDVIDQIQRILNEIGPTDHCSCKISFDDSDLSTRKLEELHKQLQLLQREKADRLKQVFDHLSTLTSLCSVLGIDFKQIVNEVHPSLEENGGSKNISNSTIESLAAAVCRLREVKIGRMQKLQDLATTIVELWNLMDTPIEEQLMFQNVTCHIAALEHEIVEPNLLSMEFLDYVEAEVLRLEDLKSHKMKELILRKKMELEEIRRRTHMVDSANNEIEFAIEAIEAGTVDASFVLDQIEAQISDVKEEAFTRKDILERVEKWQAACIEESWLEEYNRDENRYTAGRGAHIALKRAEKARALVNKIPALVEALSSRIISWEKERGSDFIYDGVHLLTMLEEYMFVRHEKEQERKRYRDQKKLQGQLIAEQEVLYGSKPSPLKPQTAKKVPRTSLGGPRRYSVGGAALQTPKANFLHSTRLTPTAKKVEGASTIHGRRGHPAAGVKVKALFNAPGSYDMEARKPFAPLVSPNHVRSPPERHSTIGTNNTPYIVPNKAPVNNLPSTPSKSPLPLLDVEDENMTPPKAAMPLPKTPMTVSVPMQVAITPVQLCHIYEPKADTEKERVEYSFEERRLCNLQKMVGSEG